MLTFEPQSRRAMLRLLSLLPMLTLIGCANNPPPAEITVVQSNTGCNAFRQITWEKADSKPTVQQILAHNRAHASLCRPKP